MYQYHMPIVFTLLSFLTVCLSPPLTAQEQRKLTDFRGNSSYTSEDLARSLFPDQESPRRARGIGQQPQGQPPPKVAVTSVAMNVFFETNSDAILPQYYADLDKLGHVVSSPQYAGYRIQIEGHTDSQGSDQYNQALSEKRADSIKRYLVEHFPMPRRT
jgi:outer membrane protein OmpA-like peptidoglycan-associated protein